MEPDEELTLDVGDDYVGTVIEKLGQRKGQMLSMNAENGMTRLIYRIPTRGLLGFRNEFLTDTKGMGVMNYVYLEYGDFAGDMKSRKSGALISTERGETVAFALWKIQERG